MPSGYRPPTSDAELATALGDGAPAECSLSSRAFSRKKPPKANDWLATPLGEADHKGQSFDMYLAATGRGRRPSVAQAARDMPTPDRKTIYIIPLGDYGTPKQQPTLQTLAAFVEAYYCLPVRLGELTERYRGEGLRALADDGNSGAKMTLNSTRVKMALAEAKKELPDAFAVLGVTLHEVAESGFIALGEACQKRHVCHVDVRSACKVGGLRVCLSVVAHELGHLFQCEHCVHFECVMNGSNHCSEIRGAPLHLCPIELRKIGSSVNHAAGGFDAVERYRALAAFYGANRLSAEAEWVTRRAAEVVQLAKRAAKKAAAAGPTPEEEAPAQEVVEEKWQPQPKPKPQPKRELLMPQPPAPTLPPPVQRQLSAFTCPSCNSELCAELRRQQTAVKCECGFEFLVEPPPAGPGARSSSSLSSDDVEEDEPMPRSQAADPPGIQRQISDEVASLIESLTQRFGLSLSIFAGLSSDAPPDYKPEDKPEDKPKDTPKDTPKDKPKDKPEEQPKQPRAKECKPPKQERKPPKTKAAAAAEDPPAPAPLMPHSEAGGRRASSRLATPVGEPFVHWLTPNRKVHVSGLRFNRCSDVFRHLHYKDLVPHEQNEADCVLYAAWNAVEVLTGPTHEPPPFMKISVPKDGMVMKALHDKSAFLHYLHGKGLTGDFSRHLYNQIITPAIVRRELMSGVVVVGLRLSAHYPGQKVVHITPDGGLHSICLVGYCEVRDKCYFIAKESTGDKRTNDVLLIGYDETRRERGIDVLEVHESAPAYRPRTQTSSPLVLSLRC